MAGPRARASAAVLLAALASVALAACGDGGGGEGATETPTTTAERTPLPTDLLDETPPSGVRESGQEPFFWRTLDDFASLRAGEPYKVLWRVTNGYAEPALPITATCLSCASPSERQPVQFEGAIASPVGSEAAGSFYPSNIELPFAGTWEITVVAGDDDLTLQVEALPSQPSSG